MANIENKSTAYVTLYADGQAHTKLPTLFVKQGDANSRLINVTVQLRDGQLKPGEGSICQLNCLRPDKSVVAIDGDVNEDGTITFAPKGSLCAVSGNVLAEVAITETAEDDSESAKITTSQFIVTVEPSISASGAVADSDDYDGVSKNIRKIAGHRKAAENAYKKLKAQEETVEKHGEAIAEVEKAVTALTEKVESFLAREEENAKAFEALNANIEALRGQISGVQEAVAQGKTESPADILAEYAKTVDERFEEIKSIIDGVKADAVTEYAKTVDERFEEIKSVIDCVKAEVANATPAVDTEISATVEALAQRVEEIAGTNDTALKNIELLRLDVRRLSIRNA